MTVVRVVIVVNGSEARGARPRVVENRRKRSKTASGLKIVYSATSINLSFTNTTHRLTKLIAHARARARSGRTDRVPYVRVGIDECPPPGKRTDLPVGVSLASRGYRVSRGAPFSSVELKFGFESRYYGSSIVCAFFLSNCLVAPERRDRDPSVGERRASAARPWKAARETESTTGSRRTADFRLALAK